MRRHVSRFLLFSTLALVSGVDAAEAQSRGQAARFSVDDAVDLVRVSDARISPDGEHVLFERTTPDWEENERTSRLWIARSDGSDARPFTAEDGDRRARWSPDGRRIAFLRSTDGEDGTTQIFIIRADGGEARQRTEHPTSIERFEWSPTGARLIFVAEDSLPDAADEAREKGGDAYRVDEGPNGQRRGQWSNLWSVAADPDGGSARPVTERDHRIGAFAVSPDGGRIAFTFRRENHRNDGFRSELAVVDVRTSRIRRLTDNAAPESDPAWSPDGRTLTFMAPDRNEWRLDQGNLYAMDVRSGAVRQLAPEFPGVIRSYAWAPDGRSIDILALERTVANLYRLDVERNDIRPMSRLEGVMSSASFSRDHGRVAFIFSSPTIPGDVYTASVPQVAPVRITEANPRIGNRALAIPQRVRWRSEDGTQIEGLLYLPPLERSEPGALVLEIHGGPAGVFTRSFDRDAQLLAGHGYAVLQPNVRGSSGYGDELLRGNMYDIGGGDYEDLMTGVDRLIERGIAHPDSLAVKGWSYGGILGGWTITQTDRFRAASLGAMVSDWRGEFGAGFHFDVVRWYLGGDPWSNREMWIERSAYTHADQVTTPTIFFHGDNDRIDTIEQTFNFHQALRHFDVPTRFVRFPREGHGIREVRHQRTRLAEEIAWFQHYVRGLTGWTVPERPVDHETTAATP